MSSIIDNQQGVSIIVVVDKLGEMPVDLDLGGLLGAIGQSRPCRLIFESTFEDLF